MKQHAIWMCVGVGLGACHPSEPPAPASTVSLREPGAEPRRALVYRPRGGDEAIQVVISPPGQPAQMTFQLRWSADGNSAAGARYRFAITDARFAAGLGDDLKPMFLSSNNGVALADAHGRLSAEPTGTAHTTPSASYLLTMFAVPLPGEPIGAGAKWHVERPSTQLGGNVGIDYELTELTADGARVRWALKSSATSDSGEAVGVEEQGAATIGFDDVVPRTAEVRELIQFPRAPLSPPVVFALSR